MRTVDDWLSEYGASHQQPFNKLMHWLCVPAIVLSMLGLAWSVPTPPALPPAFNWATLSGAAALAYYAVLSPRLALGMLAPLALAAWLLIQLSRLDPPLWQSCLAIFVIAWAGQFVGHAVEGRRPSFFKDLQFLLIGPLWLLSAVYRRLGLRY